MPDSADTAVLFTAVYDSVDDAQADLEAFDGFRDAEIIGKYDAAVIDQEDGKPHIVKRADHPAIRVIPEWFGSGTLPRRELHEAAQALEGGQAALIVVGEPTLERAMEKAITRAAKTMRRNLDTATDELARTLIDALKR